MTVYRYILCIGCIILSSLSYSQEEKASLTKRVLFILDGSGSMNERWQGESKWEMAVHTLSNLIDSFESTNKDFQIGIRVLGHQYPKTLHRCDDTKMEIDFSGDLTFEKVNNTLRNIHPKGQTPLAYAIEQSEKDFVDNIKAQNVIILITDGLENCNGNPCEVANRLKEKNIFINPYIIGLGIDSLESQKLECIGKFIDAKNKAVFREVVKTILTEVAIKTSLTIQFIKSDSSAYPFYIPYSLVDKKTGRDIHNYIYSSGTKKNLDTIQLNSQYQYHLLIHTNPPFQFADFYVNKGGHQHFLIPILSGNIEYGQPDKTKKNLYYLRTKNPLQNQWHGGIQPLIHIEEREMRVDRIQHPIKVEERIGLKEGKIYTLDNTPKGILIVKKMSNMMASIYSQRWEKLITMDMDVLNTFELVTGDYFILYKPKDEQSESSKFQSFKVIENQTTQILLQ